MVKVTHAENGKTIYINPYQIVSISGDDRGKAVIILTQGNYVCEETPEQVLEMCNKHILSIATIAENLSTLSWLEEMKTIY